LAHLALADGDLREAQRQGEAARELAGAPPDRQLEGQALLTLGLVLEQSGDARQAEDTYGQALRLCETANSCLDQATIHLYLANLCRQEGRDGEARTHLEDALALSARHGYDFLFTGRERARALPLLVAALHGTAAAEAGRLLVAGGPEAVAPLLALLETAPTEVQERVIHLLGEIGDERAVPALSSLRQDRRLKESIQAALARITAAPRPPLRVRALGGFEVARSEEPLPAAAWQRRKTRLLLLYLLTQRRAVPADEVLEALWPDLHPESAGQALNTTFSELRHILEPHLGKGMDSHYLERDEEILSWRRDSPCWYDADSFERAVRAGGAAAHQSLELYRGDFLPEEPYVDWVLRERERLRGLYLNALTVWLDERVQAGHWREGAELARHILEREPWLEEVWRALMTCCAMLGRRGEALQAYQSCVRALREELDVAPGPPTQALYEQIKGTESSIVNRQS
jgi:DNA-binding SARP family transcriptional activator